ncbi:exocyst complex component 6 [Eupeodes corollae]|uniref:exocyst complex component 6 n=1 Tax=Eupeodes corollae TaxID=290404 RepID=UPI002490B547|nr:exocyst complex component 6 [Eupeodes corollae]
MDDKLETSEDCFSSTFRSILEDKISDSLTEKIESDLKAYDRDIEKICNLFYEGFIDSINELLQVKSKVQSLNSEILQVDSVMNTISSKCIATGEKINHIRVVEKNIQKAIQWLQKCLPIFECCSKYKYYISQKQYYESLKTLEALEQDYLPTVLNYRFSLQMANRIPKLKGSIKTCSEGEFREFLENIRKFSAKIGDVSMRCTKQMQKKDVKTIIADYKRSLDNSSASAAAHEAEISAYDLIDFSPIFKTYRIYSELGYKELFEKDYRQQRKDQIKLVVVPSRPMHNDLEVYKMYITAVVGFFVVEDHVRNTADEIASNAYLEELWASSLSTFANHLNINTCLCTDPNILLKLKTIIILAINNLKSCGYVASQLWDLLYAIRDHYNEVLLQRWVHIFREILEKEDFQPMQVNSAEELENLIENCAFNFENVDKLQLPRTFPFSSMVPKVYNEAKEFMYASMKFCEDLPLMPNEVAITVRKAGTLLFTRSFNGCISSIFRNPSLTLPQIIQVILDTKYLDKTIPNLNDFICEVTGTQKNINEMNTKILYTSLEAEREVVRRICSKVDEFFDLSDYNWLLIEPSGNASTYITDMISYLRNTFESFASILPEIAQTACKRACKHISENILNILLDNEVKLITPAALQQINLDLIQCEFFAASEPIVGLKEDELMKQFLHVRQLLDLLIMEEWSSYLHDYGKSENRYYMVEPTTVVIILDKMREADKKTMFAVLKKSEREKKKLRETVQKQLKSLVDRL